MRKFFLFYLRMIFVLAPLVMRKSVKTVRGSLADIVFFVAILAWGASVWRPQVAAWIEHNLKIPQTWTPWIVIGCFILLLMRVNYDEFARIESEVNELRGVRADEDARQEARKEVSILIAFGNFILWASPKSPEESTVWEVAAKDWLQQSHEEVKAKVGEADATFLTFEMSPQRGTVALTQITTGCSMWSHRGSPRSGDFSTSCRNRPD
jgi:hypothetical protein